MGATFTTRCVHHAGSLRCRAGVAVNGVRDDEGRLPCLAVNGIYGAIECDERRAPPDQEAAAGPMARALAAIRDQRCPTCDEPVARTYDVGRNRMAQPCGHRLGRT
jgi:hypothetical protein